MKSNVTKGGSVIQNTKQNKETKNKAEQTSAQVNILQKEEEGEDKKINPQQQIKVNDEEAKVGQVENIDGLTQQQLAKNIEEIQNQKLKMIGIKSEEQVQAQVRRWKKLNQLLQRKRKVELEMKMRKQQQEKQKAQIQAKNRAQSQQALKRENIKKNLEEIEKRRQKRQERIQKQIKKNKKNKSKQHIPMFVSKIKEFQMEEQLRIKENILKKKREMMMDAEEIKHHQKKYLQQLKQRYQKKESQGKKHRRNKSLQKAEELMAGNKRSKSQFNLFLHGDSQRKQKQLEKYLRRKKFEDKVRQMPVLIDHEKMKQALIARDKAKNPLKYNYLSNVAALSDQKIYEQFKDFEINIDTRELGNQYMKQALSDVQSNHSRITKIRSQSQIYGPKSEKIEYKNYLPQIRSKLRKRVDLKLPENEIQEVMYRFQNKNQQISQLNKKSDIYELEAIRKIQQMKDIHEYGDFLGKQEAVDQCYVKSLKMKIASAQIS